MIDSGTPPPDDGPGASAAEAPSPLLFEGHHRGLRDRLIVLKTAVTGGRHRAALDALVGIRGFAEVHFADEEKLMDDVGFPSRDLHGAHHREFLEWMGTVERQAGRDLAHLGDVRVLGGLTTWWDDHARRHDRELADFLCRGGI